VRQGTISKGRGGSGSVGWMWRTRQTRQMSRKVVDLEAQGTTFGIVIIYLSSAKA